jgi:vacuolar-type H+-ATPase subunit D/Vma8
MRAISRRVYRLEKQFVPRLDDQGRSIADVIRERRRRRLAAEGREPEPGTEARTLL